MSEIDFEISELVENNSENITIVKEEVLVQEEEVLKEDLKEEVQEEVQKIVVEEVLQEIVVEEVVQEDLKEEEVLNEIVLTIPKMVFIVPYRDRVQQQEFFDAHMKKVLEDFPIGHYEITYIHQKDTRSFNRGAMKNIGFLYVKNKYPNDYQNITLIFNDVDTMPYTKNFLHFDTTFGNIKHFYGYKYALGGIVSIKGVDFERVNGFPNYWAWGYEDNAFQTRVLNAGLQIDRSEFYPIMDKNIFQMKDGLQRIVNRKEFDRYVDEYKYNIVNDGIHTISGLSYQEDRETGFINVTAFTTGVPDNQSTNQVHDLRNGTIPFKMGRRRGRMGMMMM